MRNDLYDLVCGFNNMFYDRGYKTFPIDVLEAENGYEVICEMPGVKKEDIDLSLDDGILTIKTKNQNKPNDKKYLIHERNNMRLERSVNFGDIEVDDIKAKMEDGLLNINIKLKAKENTKKDITIE